MANRTLIPTEALSQYIQDAMGEEPDILRRLRDETHALPMAMMQIGPEQGQFMSLLVALMGAKRVLEVGTFTGYSALACALALPADGLLVACDVSEEWTAIARRYWQEAGVDHKIHLKLGPATETLNGLLKASSVYQDYFDMMFIDADKTSYDAYYELGLQLVRPGGVILIDNVLWGGSVVDEFNQSPDTQAIRALNQKLRNDPRVQVSLVPMGDGLTLARKLS